MKKHFLLIMVILLGLSVTPVRAQEAKGTLTGTAKTDVGNLLISTYAVAGNGYDSVTGTITYDKNVVAFYKYQDLSPSKWKLEVDTTKPGTIKFTATQGSNPITINDETNIIRITFVVIATGKTTTEISAEGVKASYTVTETKEVEDKSVVLNQAEIDAALARIEAGEEGVVVPDPIYGTKTVEVQTAKSDKIPDVSQPVIIDQHLSNDTYLRSLSSSDGTLSPEFSKTTNTYRLTINPTDEFIISCDVEDPKSSFRIEKEVNNQVIVNVTAEDGSANAYVITIIRQENYNSPDNPVRPGGNGQTQPVTPATNLVNDRIALSVPQIAVNSVLALIALAGFIFGGRLIHLGAHNR
jgi:hypothetical protein